jgi:hypothetical protein
LESKPISLTAVPSGSEPRNLSAAPFDREESPPLDLKALDTVLYHCLFVDDIALLFNRALGETIGRDDLGLRLRLRINPPELAALPWDFLYSPERLLFLAASVETPLSRYLNLPEPIRQLACPEKINLLVVIPQNSGLDTTAERQILEKVAVKLSNKIMVDFLAGEATSVAIRDALRQKDYHILHYAGHGAFKNEQAFIYLDHPEKMIEAMTAENFAQFFLDYPAMRLVFLNACQGATCSAHQALVGLAPQLVFRGVPAVVAMQVPIDNDDAILFATEFYAELCRASTAGQVEIATSIARKALLQEKPTRPAFGNSVLYLRAEDGKLWETQKTAPPELPAKGKKPVLERWQTWVGLIGGILAILAALTELPGKAVKIYELLMSNHKPDSTQTTVELKSQTLEGQIVDEQGEPLPGVIVYLQGYGYDTTVTTNEWGKYKFEIEAPVGARAKLQARKSGYEILNQDPLLGGKPDTFQMHKLKRLK